MPRLRGASRRKRVAATWDPREREGTLSKSRYSCSQQEHQAIEKGGKGEVMAPHSIE